MSPIKGADLVPIFVGAKGKDVPEGFVRDDVGDNISDRNGDFCELTAHYYMWKNVEADAYGLFQYRRVMVDKRTRRPYVLVFRRKKAERLIAKTDFEGLLKTSPMILPRLEDMKISVREHFGNTHNIEDLREIEGIIKEHFPEYSVAVDTYLNGTMCLFGNMFVMTKERFLDYSKWLFCILGYQNSPTTPRRAGYLAEPLQGIYATYHNDALFLPKAEIAEYFPHPVKKYLLYFLLPPGTKRRARAKKLFA